MLLKHFYKDDYFSYDPLTDREMKLLYPKAKVNGLICHLNDHCLSIYKEEDDIFLQIDTNRWRINEPSLRLDYVPDFIAKKIRFQVKSCDNEFRITYDAWFKDFLENDPEFYESAEDEDFFAYVVQVWKTPKMQVELLSAWGA